MKKNYGISLISLVITIAVAIILTTIVIQTSSDAPKKAHYANYAQIMKNVQVGVDNIKIENVKRGLTEEKMTLGFQKVYLENAPAIFVSFGDIYEPITGYVVSLETIGYENAEFGKEYQTYFEQTETPTITFGEEESDVYVIDADWRVFYVRGVKYNGSMNYYLE